MRTHTCSVAATEIFCGGIEGEKCDSERAKYKNLLKMLILVIHFFLLMGGAEPLMGGQNAPCPLAP